MWHRRADSRRQGGSYTKFTTVEEIVALHPSSVNFSQKGFSVMDALHGQDEDEPSFLTGRQLSIPVH